MTRGLKEILLMTMIASTRWFMHFPKRQATNAAYRFTIYLPQVNSSKDFCDKRDSTLRKQLLNKHFVFIPRENNLGSLLFPNTSRFEQDKASHPPNIWINGQKRWQDDGSPTTLAEFYVAYLNTMEILHMHEWTKLTQQLQYFSVGCQRTLYL